MDMCMNIENYERDEYRKTILSSPFPDAFAAIQLPCRDCETLDAP